LRAFANSDLIMGLQVIIDRVGNTNVFNIVQDKNVNNPFLKENEILQSVIDDDLIEEYLGELSRIANISRSLSSLPKADEENQALIFQHLNLNTKLRQIGEAIFRQFFPEALQKFIRETNNTYLFFHIDPKLASVPLEILHDGAQFLWEKFFLGKSVKGQQSSLEAIVPKENLNLLIIADPTEDLEWARKEGEALFEYLSANFPEKKLNIELIGGRSITKLTLLNALTNKDLVHYSGHLHYSERPEENGWVLFDGKIIHAREVQKSGAEPLLIFSNSCLSGRGRTLSESDANWYTNFAGSFIKSGKTNYIGTNWELPDSEPTLSFTLEFYDHLLKGETIGKALQQARLHARSNFTLNDLTWASYLLMGNPSSHIFQAEAKLPDLTQNILDYEMVLAGYPYPIARAFQNFVAASADEHSYFNDAEKSRVVLDSLVKLFEQSVFFLAAIVMANYQYLSLPRRIDFLYPNVKNTLDNMFDALNSIKALKIPTIVANMLETLFVHKENLYKISGWCDAIKEGDQSADAIESFVITIQYLVEGFLMDIEFVKNNGFYRIVEPGHRQLNLSGLRNHHRIKEIILPTQANSETQEELLKKTSELIGRCVFYNPVKKIFLDLDNYLELSVNSSEGSKDQEYKIHFKRPDSLSAPSSSPKKAKRSTKTAKSRV